jgi:hypothetical protein
MLAPLRRVAGVVQLAGARRLPGSLVLQDAGSANLASMGKPLAAADLAALAARLARAVAGTHRRG